MFRLSLCFLLVGCASATEMNGPGGGVDAPTGGTVDGPGGSVDAPEQETACDIALRGHAQGFEAGAAGWTHVILDGAAGQASWPFDEWQHGQATSGPNSCHGGTGCWATRLDANYTSCQRAALVSPAIDLSECTGRAVSLSFWSWHDFWTGTAGTATTWFDGGLVEVSTDGTSWSTVTPSPAYSGTIDINPKIGQYECVLSNQFHVDGKQGFVGNGGGWQQITIPIAANQLVSTFRVRFAYSSGVSFASNDPEVDRQHTRAGWYLDDLAFDAQ